MFSSLQRPIEIIKISASSTTTFSFYKAKDKAVFIINVFASFFDFLHVLFADENLSIIIDVNHPLFFRLKRNFSLEMVSFSVSSNNMSVEAYFLDGLIHSAVFESPCTSSGSPIKEKYCL